MKDSPPVFLESEEKIGRGNTTGDASLHDHFGRKGAHRSVLHQDFFRVEIGSPNLSGIEKGLGGPETVSERLGLNGLVQKRPYAAGRYARDQRKEAFVG